MPYAYKKLSTGKSVNRKCILPLLTNDVADCVPTIIWYNVTVLCECWLSRKVHNERICSIVHCGSVLAAILPGRHSQVIETK